MTLKTNVLSVLGFLAKHGDPKDADYPHRNQQATSSPEFKKWFADSKVVDKDGNPLVVYHGSNSEFDVFDTKLAGSGGDKGLRGRGFYFSPNKKTSSSYGSVVTPVYISIQNPFKPSDFSSKQEIADKLGIDDSTFQYDKESGDFRVYSSFAGMLTSAMKDAGYDGVIYEKGQEIIAFSPNQIKSSINNTSFDPNSPSIFK